MKRWTKADLDYLRRHRSQPLAAQAEALGCTRKQVADARHNYQIALPRRTWTRAEDRYIRANPNTPLIDQAIALGRSVSAVQSRRGELSVGPTRNRRPWSATEDACVRACAASRVSAWECAVKLGRHDTEVASRRVTLGVISAIRTTEDDLQTLSELWHLSTREVTECLGRGKNWVWKYRAKLRAEGRGPRP